MMPAKLFAINEKQLRYLIKRDFILRKLEEYGVDNWEGADDAFPDDEEMNEAVNILIEEFKEI